MRGPRPGRQRRPLHRPGRSSGFTLIELMIAVAVIGIIAAIAIPSYLDSVRKSRRSDAFVSLQQIQLEQEKFRAACGWYAQTLTGTRACGSASASGVMGFPSATSTDGYYTLEVVASSASATGFTARATASSTKSQFSDTNCRSLSLAVSGLTVTTSALTSAGASSSSCWTK